MKKGLLLVMLPFLLFAQNKQSVKLNYPVKDYTGTTRSFEVIDARKDQTIKDIVFRGKYYSFKFPTDNLSQDLENWFEKANKKRDKGTNDIVMLVEGLNISNDIRNKEIFCVLEMKFSTFLKKDNSYYFLKRYDNVISLNTKEVGGIPDVFSENTQKVLQKLMFDTYRAAPLGIAIPSNELIGYNETLKSNYPAFSETGLKDGVYLDYNSFFNQTPIDNYQLIKNKDEVVRAVNSKDERIPARKIYSYVENGKAYKNTQAGFLDLQKDQRGYFVMGNKYMLFPEEINVSSAYFLFGVVGGIAAGIEFNVKYNKALKDERYPIYIDFLNGEYSFEK
ncbi:hypothetical protein Q73A0000_12350 [Kaistella flava (ex Peng et al. 2021)]|uniref:Uncharacterized protein n=1 Tax=Kaistella flava (ex Peng et al. 2021) TaxID=2038776 RepID=A0A7M2YA98_9FLAO|nr:hypothetical protein [Kaistella flava (ex Peng et al. 2021)]QOW11091.1 hypothetical protein Q73A0000_12350 [Kaistella flava (ex Peng et al. 2021)]